MEYTVWAIEFKIMDWIVQNSQNLESGIGILHRIPLLGSGNSMINTIAFYFKVFDGMMPSYLQHSESISKLKTIKSFVAIFWLPYSFLQKRNVRKFELEFNFRVPPSFHSLKFNLNVCIYEYILNTHQRWKSTCIRRFILFLNSMIRHSTAKLHETTLKWARH